MGKTSLSRLFYLKPVGRWIGREAPGGAGGGAVGGYPPQGGIQQPGLSAAPQAEPQALGFSAGLSAAPQAEPQAEAGPDSIVSLHPNRLESAIFLSSLGFLSGGFVPRLQVYCSTGFGGKKVRTILLLSHLAVTMEADAGRWETGKGGLDGKCILDYNQSVTFNLKLPF